MFSKVSVLVPTRGRIARLRTMISSFDQTTGNAPDAELVFRVDNDDAATNEFLIAWGGHRIVYGERGSGYRDMGRYINEAVCAADGDVLMIGNDDMIFRTPDWPAMVLAKANEFPDGLFDIGVSTYNEDHWPFATVSKKAIDALGFMWDPRVYWGDIFLRDAMGMLGRAVKLPEVVIEHDWAGHAPDSTFIEADQNSIYQREPHYWSTTHATAVAEAVSKLKHLEGAAA